MNHGTVLETLVLHSWLWWSISHHDGNGNNFARAAILHAHVFVHFFAVAARTERIIQPKRENPGKRKNLNYLIVFYRSVYLVFSTHLFSISNMFVVRYL